ncbi:uncharacterized protein LAESUDRAFT_731789 [Laetiporus sulphureus 93-53]|uniref:Zn(2)-C6 fungal-type domain-containing protein n=1 Tax=Laetiporus sulphureus 93-53 TaxID=1314785 RepID=A0A165BFJ6_9APHY|nr:uncharacterized protein LAESUDRAFT_731789 [Laetiporus sulphureus 93-53]KZT00948.1 hypothetical protein LAESUDRAFT_731789 [Laetiporus sulphureus 93-53]
MSSQEDEPHDADSSAQNLKKRRVQRACDVCRRKKIRCDGGQMPNNRCSNCVTYNYECSYIEAAKKRGPPKGYVESLETRLEKMEKLLNKLCPDADFSKELGGHFDKAAWLAERDDRAGRSTAAQGVQVVSSATPHAQPTDPDELEPSDDEVMAHYTLVQSLRRMRINPNALRFFGKSSSIMFVRTAMDLKREYSGNSDEPLPEGIHARPELLFGRRRQGHYSLHPWLSAQMREELEPHKPQNFPEDDLMWKLIDLYFVNVNVYLPFLHRPTFERGVRAGLHLDDEGFGSTVLLVCANGARFTDDPRVLLPDGDKGEKNSLSCGWEWFKQVQMIRKSLLAPPQLYDLQIYCLTALFLQGSSAPQACWTIIGVGIRMAQDVGAHRKKVYNAKPTVDEELWKRAFWVLVALDRSMSSALGRPCAIQDEDFDLDLPTECDDEYWETPDPDLAFKQPPGKPSVIAFFNCFIRLNQILGFALRTIYSINKSKALLGFVGQQWEQHIVAELDSALNKWIDSVPDHLRWDPNRENITFLNQSAHLYASYYMLQVSVHRPFIPSPRKPSPLSFPSLAICTNAARSCTHVMDIQYKRTGGPLYLNMMATFTSGIVLLLNIWGGKRSGLSTDPNKEMAEVHKCMKMLKCIEPQWHTAGRLWDILYELASVGDLPLPGTPPSHKRERDSDSPKSSTSNASNAPTPSDLPTMDTTQRSIAGSRRVSRDTSSMAASIFGRQPISPQVVTSPEGPINGLDQPNMHSFALPIHSDELGRLPLHPGFSMDGHVHSPMGNAWYTAGPSSAVSPLASTSQAGALNGAELDPALTSLFAMPNPNMYGSIFSAMPGQYAAPSPQDFSSQIQGMQDPGGANLPGGVQGAGSSFTDNTLAMWSAAPSGFEWDDWGSYISSVSGLNNPMGSGPSRPAGG